MDRTTLIDDIATIAQIPSPTFGEHQRLDWIARRLAHAPGSARRDDVGNVIWSWGGERPSLLLTAHVDTVFPESTPIVIRREGDRMVGPGVGDNAAAIAVAIRVVENLLEDGDRGSGAVAFTVCEEGLGNLRGARHACESLQPPVVIALEGHGLESVVADALGSIRAGSRSTGRVATPGKTGSSECHPCADWHRGAATGTRRRASAGQHRADPGRPGSQRDRRQRGARRRKRSANAGELASFVDTLHALSGDPHLQLTVEILGDRAGGILPRDSMLLTTVMTVRHELGLQPLIEFGSTDANAAMGLGIDALSLGVCHGRDMHTTTESIDIDSLPARDAASRARARGAPRRLSGARRECIGRRRGVTRAVGPD